MQWLESADEYFENFRLYVGMLNWRDVMEIFIIAVLVYWILAWMKTTRAWRLLKGMIIICVFLLLAYRLEMNTIIWIAKNILGFAVTAVIVVLQPELRHALEELGEKKFLSSIPIYPGVSRRTEGLFSEQTIAEIAKACVEMGKTRTGALIVIEKKESLKDYERTGIEVDGVVTNQLLINIFEHNTPLHDGAVIVRGNRVTYATCYLPLTDNLDLSKELGTRHRAGVGISEVTDSMTVIVSEETGKISIAYEGELQRNLSAEELKAKMRQLLNMNEEEGSGSGRRRKGRSKSKNDKKGIT